MKLRSLIVFLMISSFVLSVVSCGGNPTELLQFINSSGEELDLMGRTVKICDTSDQYFESTDNTVLSDEIIARLKEIGSSYNCVIERKTFNSDAVAYNDYIMAAMTAGICPCDLMFTHGNNIAATFAYANLLYPLTDLKEIINYEDSSKYGSAGILEGAMHNGIPYAVQPVQWLYYQENFSSIIAYNKQMVKTNGYADLHEYYENKTWTWDTFETVLSTYKVTTANETLPVFGANKRTLTLLILWANGVRFAGYIDGEFKSDLYEQKTLNAIEWYRKLYNEYRDEIKDLDFWTDADIANGSVVMSLVTGLNAVYGTMQMNSDYTFGLMPFPCGPDVEYGEWAEWAEAIRGFSIPANNEDPEVAAHIISDLCEPFDVFGNINDYFNSMIFSDPLDTEIFFESSKNIRYNYMSLDTYTFVNNMDPSYTAQQMVEKFAPAMEDMIENYIKPNYENYIYAHMDKE